MAAICCNSGNDQNPAITALEKQIGATTTNHEQPTTNSPRKAVAVCSGL